MPEPATFRPVDPSVLDHDPFWSVVRQRHPDLDVVILPPEPAALPSPHPTQPLAEVREAAAGLIGGWRLLQPLIADADPAEPERGPSVRWEQREGDVLLLQRAVTGIGQEAGTALLRSLALTLGGAGWLLRPGVRRELPLLEATDGALHLDAVAGPGATVLTLTGRVVAADAGDQRLVLGEVLAQVRR